MPRDTTQRPRFSEDWLVAVLDSLSEGVIALAADGRILAANPAAEDLLLFRISERRGDPWDHLTWRELVDEERVRLRDDQHPVAATLEDGRARGPDVVGLPGDGPSLRWLALATHVLPSEDPETSGGVIVSFQDHTDRVRAEHDLHRLVAMLRDFVATATHDLRSPLMAIVGHAQMLASSWGEMAAPDRGRSIQTIERQAGVLQRLVDDLSVVARLEAGGIPTEPAAVEVRGLIDLALDVSIASDAFRVDVPEGTTALVDPDHARRMLVNLIDNAAKYGRPPYEISARSAGGTVELAVADGGAGVPDAFVPRLFERFTRDASTGTSGTGLGLAIVAGLARLNDGEVSYEHNAPRGARFTLRLPRADRDA